MFRAVLLTAIVTTSLASAPLGAAGAEAPGTLTLLEGDALIYRGDRRVRALEGLRLAFGDIVETGASAFVQIELFDRSVLQLGPATRLMLDGSGANGRRKRWLYVIDGWVKLSSSKRDPDDAGGFEIHAPWLDIASNFAVVVLRIAPSEAAAFVERGRVAISERGAAGPVVVALEAGDCYRREARAPGSVDARAKPAFVAGMPRWFRDTLPLRIDRFRELDVEPAPASDFSYADVQMWLQAEPPLRRQFVRRWSAKSRDAAFRAALLANLAAHTEWAPIVSPPVKRSNERLKGAQDDRPKGTPPWLPPPLLGPASSRASEFVAEPPPR